MRRASKVERSMIRKVTQPADCCSQCPVIVGSLGRAAETRQGAKRCEKSSIERVNGESSIVANRLEAEDPPSRSKRRKSWGIDRLAILRTNPKNSTNSIRSDPRSISNKSIRFCDERNRGRQSRGKRKVGNTRCSGKGQLTTVLRPLPTGP